MNITHTCREMGQHPSSVLRLRAGCLQIGHWQIQVPGVKEPEREDDRSPPSSARRDKHADLYPPSHIHLEGVLLRQSEKMSVELGVYRALGPFLHATRVSIARR